MKKYTDWRTSDWVASIAPQIKTRGKLMLIYNTIQGEDLSLNAEDVPVEWVITTDRRYLQQADTVVVHLPTLHQALDNDLEKLEGQIWVAGYLESQKDHPLINDPERSDIFDMWMCYRKEEDQYEHPLLFLCREIYSLIV